MRKALIIFFIAISQFAKAGKVEKGFEALQILDYFKAKELFLKALDKEPAGAGYGLAMVYMQDKSPFYSIDSAYKYLNISDKAFKKVDDKQLESLALLAINQAEINKQHKILATLFYVEVEKENTQEGYQDFIDYHPLANEREEAKSIRNHFAFEKAQEINSMEGYKTFMKDYPNAADFDVAQQAFYALEYDKYTDEGNAFSYQVFVKNKPENPFIKDAQIEIYRIYTQHGKADDFELFIDENPNNPKVEEAWSFLYALKTGKGSPSDIAEFIIDYPDYPHPNQLKEDLKLAQIQYFPVQKGSKFGYVDTNGHWLITPTYEWASKFNEGKAAVGLLGNSVYIDKKGKVLYHHMLSDAASFKKTNAIVEFNDFYGVINFMGDTVIPIIYDEVGEFTEGLIYVGQNNKYGYYNENGELKIPLKYDIAYDFVEGKALIGVNNKYGVINVLGQEIIPPSYDHLVLDSSVCIARIGNRFGLISYAGDTILSFDFDKISVVSDGKVMAAKGNSYQYYNVDGSLAFKRSFAYNEATFNYSGFKNGYARITIENKVGIIDAQGKKIYPAIFMDVGRFENDLTPVNKTGLWGYANSKVKLEIPYGYQYANSFKDSTALVKTDTAWGVINKQNQFIVPPVYQSITRIDTLLLVQKNNSFGVINMNNDTILPVLYSSVTLEQFGSYATFVTYQNGKQSIYWIDRKQFIYREE